VGITPQVVEATQTLPLGEGLRVASFAILHRLLTLALPTLATDRGNQREYHEANRPSLEGEHKVNSIADAPGSQPRWNKTGDNHCADEIGDY